MTFIWPIMLLGLVVIPLLVYGYVQMLARRKRLVAQFSSQSLLQQSSNRGAGARRHIPMAIFLLALAILIVALARPQTVVSLPRLEGTIILAFDVSGSMAATDLQPTRLQAAQVAAQKFIEQQPSTVDIGIVSFSEGGFSTQAPTNDRNLLLSALSRMTVQRGTSIGSGISAALAVIEAGSGGDLTLVDRPADQPLPTPTAMAPGSYQSAVIVLLTDGENTQDPDPLEVAQFAADRGVRIHTIGVGSTEGATLEVDGFTITSRLDEETLQLIAEITGGTYHNAQNEEELEEIYSSVNPQIVFKEQDTEVTSLFAGMGILVLIVGGTLSLFLNGRMP